MYKLFSSLQHLFKIILLFHLFYMKRTCLKYWIITLRFMWMIFFIFRLQMEGYISLCAVDGPICGNSSRARSDRCEILPKHPVRGLAFYTDTRYWPRFIGRLRTFLYIKVLLIGPPVILKPHTFKQTHRTIALIFRCKRVQY